MPPDDCLWKDLDIKRLCDFLRDYDQDYCGYHDFCRIPATDLFSNTSLITHSDLNRLSDALSFQISCRRSPIGSSRNATSEQITFDVELQRRPGTRHGMGGRPRGMTPVAFLDSIPKMFADVAVRSIVTLCGGSVLHVPHKLRDALLDTLRDDGFSEIELREGYFESIIEDFKQITTSKVHSSVETLDLPFLSFCFKAPRSLSASSWNANSMERHAVCTWIDSQGSVRCTCIGSTVYRLTDHSAGENTCLHSNGFLVVVDSIAKSFEISKTLAGKVLSRFYAASSDTDFSHYMHSLPKIYKFHKGSVLVVVCSENPSDGRSTMFVPVRHLTKGSTRNVCAFCDSVLNGSCHHTRTISLQELEKNVEFQTQEEGMYEETELDSISRLPLAPVNCRKALEMDNRICDLIRASTEFVLVAPSTCPYCGCARNESSRKLWREGVLMCTIGPCKFHTEEFRCSSGSCGAKIFSEGRDHYIVIDKFTSAATHALMRRELYGVVVSNGTITGRLSHFHSMVTANAHFGIIPPLPTCRSVKTLLKLCAVMLRLMSASPPLSLFHCNYCERNAGMQKQRMSALCMDGISQGFVKNSAIPFKNISEKCVSLKPSTSLTKGRATSALRPLTGLVRESKPVSILLDAIQGNKLCWTSKNEKDFACALRMISESAIPPEFYSSTSVCGKTRGDVSEDIGEKSILNKIRNIVTSIFDPISLTARLLIPLNDNGRDRKLVAHIDRKLSDCYCAANGSLPLHGICWKWKAASFTQVHIENDIFNLFKMLLQGPVLQFVRKSDLVSLARLSSICSNGTLEALGKVLKSPQQLLQECSPGDTDVLSALRILRAGLTSVKELEESGLPPYIRRGFGGLLGSCFLRAREFYAFYERSGRSESAFAYRDRWGSSNEVTLRLLMADRYGDLNASSDIEEGSHLLSALRTGSYFPDRPQLRPLPFNDEEISENDFQSIPLCSKDFLQRQRSFTPGALTFSCSCDHPIILGFKVLHRNEGPRAILDTIVSRFAELPEYLIYDFCCGLFVAAVHCLWWAFSNVFVVCDNFHSRNHTCSPGFLPKSHSALSHTNTVAHEQRNRAISRLGLSLRNCGQELYISLLSYQTIVLNLRAHAKKTNAYLKRPKGISDIDVEWCYFQCLGLECTCCSP